MAYITQYMGIAIVCMLVTLWAVDTIALAIDDVTTGIIIDLERASQ